MPIPVEMRKKMLGAVERGESVASVARRFEVSERGLRKLIKRCAQRGTIEPAKPGPKGSTKLTAGDDATMLALVKVDPGMTLGQIAARLSVTVAESTISRRLKKLGVSLKRKSLLADEQRRPDVAVRRRNFAIASRFVEPGRFVFLDESGAKTNMTRRYGRSPVGERCRFFSPHGRWRTTTMISAVRMDGVIADATMLLDGPMNAPAFHGYVARCLAPALRPGDVVVMDNLGAHRAAGVETVIEAAGASLWWLPPYSPDFNPIEQVWSMIKAWLKRVGADTFEGLTTAVGQAVRAISTEECRNCFAACGYGT